jgi:S1-C subfamily serine protease
VDFGVIVSDAVPGGPADTAGLKIQDIILSVDDTSTGSLLRFAESLYLHNSGERVKIEVMRGSDCLQLEVRA